MDLRVFLAPLAEEDLYLFILLVGPNTKERSRKMDWTKNDGPWLFDFEDIEPKTQFELYVYATPKASGRGKKPQVFPTCIR